jgi:TetR/AcrR family transcriptional regulator
MNSNSDDTKLSRKEREFLARRKEILEAATRLFARKGYHGTAMSEIAKEAEFSTGSLYNFFQNKEELYFTLLREKIEALEVEVYPVLGSDAGVEERLRIWVDQVLGYFERERDFYRIFAEQRAQFESTAKGEFSDVLHDKIQNYLAKMVSLMEQGIREGLFKPMSAAELAMIFFGITNNILVVFLSSDEPYDLRSKGRLILDIFFNGTRQPGKRPGGGEDK